MTYTDTNILIYLLEGHEQYASIVADLLKQFTEQNGQLITSVITITEFLAGTTASSLETLHRIPRLQFISLDEALAESAAQLQRKHPAMHIGDAVHLATALESRATLFFTNDKLLAKIASEYMKVKSLGEN